MRRFGSLLLAVALLAPTAAASAQEASPTAQETPPAAQEAPSGGVDFGDYVLVPLDGQRQPYAGPATPTSLKGIPGAAEIRKRIGPEAARALARQGFVIVPSDLPRFSMAYESQLYEGVPSFVTTDAAYHTWHLVFDKILRDLEQRTLLPRLKSLVSGMLERAQAQATELAGSPLADDADKVVDVLSVAAASLDMPVDLSPAAQEELALVKAHEGNLVSPILGTYIDYSLYAPRGHYTRTPALQRYFVTMSVLGQTAFLLPGSQQIDDSMVDDPGPLRLATLASRTLVGHPELEALWQDIYEPSGFLVGVADDYTPFELATAVEAVAPGAMADPALLADDATMLAVGDELRATREVRIDSQRPSVRLMGTRFVIDSWVLDQLVWPNVGTDAQRRKWASPLDLAAAFGSDLAYGIQEAAGETAYANYPEQMTALREALAARPDDAWGRTVYDAWLAALEPKWLPNDAAYPDFMRTEAWDTRDQQAGFGSYAELRHDTILYVKQFVGELGAAGPPEVEVRDWVEPDPVVFGRLAEMARLMRAGLAERDLLKKPAKGLLEDYIAMVERLARLAEDELAGRPISAADSQWIKEFGGLLEGFWWRTSDLKPGETPAMDEMAAVIADIGSADELAVEIGTGMVDTIYVLVPDDQGRPQIAQGGVYSYYEFLQPVADRLTDEAWRQMLMDGQAPERPAWQAVLFR